MKLEYTVHSVAAERVPFTVQHNGQDVDALIQGVTVELVNSGHGHTYRFTDPQDVATALAWEVGSTVTFSKDEI